MLFPLLLAAGGFPAQHGGSVGKSTWSGGVALLCSTCAVNSHGTVEL